MADVAVHPEGPFSLETFDLLAQLEENSKPNFFYLAHQEEFKQYVEKPFQKLYCQVVAQLPSQIKNQLKIDIQIFPDKFNNTFGYILYQNTSSFSSTNTYLFILISKSSFCFGLLIQDSSLDKQRFINNYKQDAVKEVILQHTQLSIECDLHSSSNKNLHCARINRLGDWLRLLSRQNSATKDIRATVQLQPNEVLVRSNEQLSTQIEQTFKGLFPLFIIATSNEPIQAIQKYLDPFGKYLAELSFNEGVIKYKQGNYQDSISKFDYALDKGWNLGDAYKYRGQAKAELGDIDGAISDYNQLLLIQPNNFEVYYNRGNAYCQLKDYDTAIKNYNQSLNINPNFAFAYYHRGRAYIELENKQRAIENLRRALKLFKQKEDMNNYDEQIQAIHEELSLLLQNPEYSLSQVLEQTGFDETELKYWLRAIERKKQVIFSGSPGTGKTFIAEHLARHLTGDKDDQWELVQFHPAYSYEDFIQGIRPQSQDGQLKYPLVPGRFLEFCKKAESREGLCVLIIDEINRANLAQVFGELMYLLEYRDKKIRLAGSNELFGIPENVRIIGTMNTADRSIALVDHALRRRFAFIELRPNYEVLRRYHEKHKTGFQVDGLIETLKRLNNAIANKHYEIGISFFLTENLAEELEDIWQMEIEPYLEEYFFDQLDKVDDFRWDKIKQQVGS